MALTYIGVLNTVREIISKLTPEEKTSIALYLGFFVERGKISGNKSIRLFELLLSLKDRHMTEADIELLIYAKPNPKAFARLTARLRDKILEGLLLDVNVYREGAYPEKVRVNMEVRKNISQAQILQNRGARKVAESIFEKAIVQSKKYELYDELLLVLRFLIKQRTLDEGAKNLSTLLNLYHKYDYARNAVLNAEINHRKIISEIDFYTERTMEPGGLKTMLDTMRRDYKKTNSGQVGYYYFLVEAQYYQLQSNYKNARKSLLNNQRLLELSLSIGTPLRLASIFLNLADNDLYLNQFERSYATSKNALSILRKNNFNYFLGIELMFYARYYAGQYENAKNMLTELMPEKEIPENFRTGKRIYLSASASFMLGDFHTTHRYLKILNPIEEDKEGWNTGMRLLLIMTLIELDFCDEATAKIEALRKFIAAKSISDQRLGMILNLLNSLAHNGYAFKTVYLKEKAKIELLESEEPPFAWKLKSAEMVIFQQWFIAKTFRHKFRLRIPGPKKSSTEEILKQDG